MFLDFFGLSKNPFEITPNPQYVYLGEQFAHTRRALCHDLLNNHPVTLLCGPPGVGKTLLLRLLQDDLRQATPPREAVFCLCHPLFSADDLIRLAYSKAAAHAESDRAAASPERAEFLLVDEVQILSSAELSRLLQYALANELRMVLAGQSAIERVLNDKPFAEQAFNYHRLEPLPQNEVDAFIKTRLKTSGCPNEAVFTPEATARIGAYSSGVPRIINVLCSAALFSAFLDSSERVCTEHVDLAANDCSLSLPNHRATRPSSRAHGTVSDHPVHPVYPVYPIHSTAALDTPIAPPEKPRADTDSRLFLRRPSRPRRRSRQRPSPRFAIPGFGAIVLTATLLLYAPKPDGFDVQSIPNQAGAFLAAAFEPESGAKQVAQVYRRALVEKQTLIAERDLLARQVAESSDALRQAQRAKEEMIEELVRLEARSATLNNERMSLKNRLALYENELAELRQAISQAEARADNWQAAYQQTQAELAQVLGVLPSNPASVPARETEMARFDSGEPQPSGNPAPAPSLAKPAKAQVYIHHTAAQAKDNETAQRLARYLEDRGFAIAAVRGVKFGISSGSVRYFFPDDQQASTNLMKQLGLFFEADKGKKPQKLLDFTYYEPKPHQGTLEIWLPNS